ncbi:hypothetical protein [Bacteroides fragilis]|uniref:hypothetical protein n=1 Tax=Bacteroides fragilis TaxID=817 RepID=UPI001C70AD2B|nr:hypothetical protein [Bacteroides fragilis]MBW9276708.1 hypothetical protein [Bacteroides fragilis]
MEINEAMLIVAEEVARELDYIEVSKNVIKGFQDDFWGNRAIAADKQVKSCLYILPQWDGEKDERKRSPKIKIDMYWGKPRLGIDYPDGSFCCLTYKDGKVSEAQAFGENGLSRAVEIQQRIDKLINQ